MRNKPRARLGAWSPAATVATLVTCVLVFAVLMTYALPSVVRDQREEARCGQRLLRVGRAAIMWIDDNGRTRYPPIQNPTPAALWRPGRPGAIDTVLGDYLSGDVRPPRREGESETDHLARLRNGEWSVCPVSGFDYWYESRLNQGNPSRDLLGDQAEVVAFTCQMAADGSAPHVIGGQPCVQAVSLAGVVRLVHPEEVDELRQAINRIENDHRDDPTYGGWDLRTLRQQLIDMQAASEAARLQDPHSGGSFPVVRLEAIVGIQPR